MAPNPHINKGSKHETKDVKAHCLNLQYIKYS